MNIKNLPNLAQKLNYDLIEQIIRVTSDINCLLPILKESEQDPKIISILEKVYLEKQEQNNKKNKPRVL